MEFLHNSIKWNKLENNVMSHQIFTYKEIRNSNVVVGTTETTIGSFQATHGAGTYKIRCNFMSDNRANLNVAYDIQVSIKRNSTYYAIGQSHLIGAYDDNPTGKHIQIFALVPLDANDYVYFRGVVSITGTYMRCHAVVEKVMDYRNDV